MGAVYAIVSVADQHVTVYDADGQIARSRVSTGMPGHPTPIGLFSILAKERWHHSNIYSGAPMPFMQRITWSGVAMHLGVVPGYPASHGCIRLPAGFAQQFWGMTQVGNRVVIARHDTYPAEISSAVLPAPKLQPAPEVLPGGEQNAGLVSAPVKLASMSETAPVNSAATMPEPPTSPTSAVKLLNPIDYAKVLKERALASKVATDVTAKDALRTAKIAEVEDHQAGDDVKKAELNLRAAQSKLESLNGRSRTAATLPDAVADNASAEATAQVERARETVMEAQSRAEAKRQAAFAAVQAWKDAVTAGDRAADAMNEAGRRMKPVSVLFSKKEGQVFIRQNWKDVYEAPITFKDLDRPIGTHLFIAVDGDASGKLKWSAISVPSGTARSQAQQRGRAKSNKSADTEPTPQGDTAAAALERVEIGDDLRQRIAELVWIGAQIIVTDNARSDGMDEDFRHHYLNALGASALPKLDRR